MNKINRKLFYRVRDKNLSDKEISILDNEDVSMVEIEDNLSNYEYVIENSFDFFSEENLSLKRK